MGVAGIRVPPGLERGQRLLKEEKKNRKYRGSFLLKFAVFCLALFVAFILVSKQLEIAEKRQTLEGLQTQLDQQKIRNSELEDQLEDSSGLTEYAEKKARRDLDYARPDERIFVDVGGGD